MIRLNQVSLLRGGKKLLVDSDLVIHPGQKVGLTGVNGSGKSSLFALLLGETHADTGDISMPDSWRVAHMAQEVAALDRSAVDYVLDGDAELRRIENELKAAENQGDDLALARLHAEYDAHHGYSARSRAEQLLHGLGFRQEQVDTSVKEFSGGWRMRLNLAKTLMCPSDLMLLDEPTNHLDMDAILWLEEWLKRYPGTLILISHDRDFLDTVIDNIAHIERQDITLYRGNYTAFERIRGERLAQQQAIHEKQQREQERLTRFIERFRAKATKAKQAQSRIKALVRMDMVSPVHMDSPFRFRFPTAKKMSHPLLAMRSGSLGYDTALLKNVVMSLQPGDTIGLLGPNGAGKSTLVKSLAGQLQMLAGEEQRGEHLKIGYFAQHQLEALDQKSTPAIHIQRLSPEVREQEIKDFLGSFGFHGEKVDEQVGSFSGGEQARLALAIIAWQKPNLLLLDEPTNHLDLEMRHALTMALQEFDGAMVLVSHDRHMLRYTVDKLYLVHDGAVEPYEGDLDEYASWLAKQKREEAAAASASNKDEDRERITAQDRKNQKRLEAELRKKLRPFRQAVEKLEKQMDKAQSGLASLEEQLGDSSLYEESSKLKLKELLEKQAKLVQESNTIEEQWLQASEELEEAEAELEQLKSA
ncbi:ATP-binding cassette domain-containing protein [Sansalvadorimonas sp. 2012CJ34-2]|uniref:ATP-binding cassette domain-containing protein n=1 Tax=Parendozoicomonas callyspongiae TaxID=2942213 RepID=A0ABT0PIH6_9GAMM|nr:ATP-binding cassette domain-containing protein [Sansalvadorimonas sp. 2012CJ34-2]MCL6271179.1 ATP-binding cassette domain-containing protein [Sansalvadorimonas sp. 2012CJ34-2]